MRRPCSLAGALARPVLPNMSASVATQSPPPQEYRFRWTAATHRSFYRALQREVSRRGVLRFVVPGAIVVVVAVTLLAIIGARVPAGTVLLTLSPYLVLFALWLALLKWGLPYVSAYSYRRAHAPCIPHDQIRVVNADGFEARCVTSTVQVRWPGIVRVVETPEFLLFFTTPSCAIQLPKRAVPSEEALEELRTSLRHYLGARAELTSVESGAAAG